MYERDSDEMSGDIWFNSSFFPCYVRRKQLQCMEAEERARQLAQAEENCRRAEHLAIQRYNQALVITTTTTTTIIL